MPHGRIKKPYGMGETGAPTAPEYRGVDNFFSL